jgi:phosphoglycerol transferase MdoB-like AlkP superfamily enzyme
MMESFATHLTNYDSPTFNVLGELKKHFDSDILFRRFVSGDIGTIGSLESILMNTPKRPESKYITQSKYAFTSYASGMAVPYQQAGYETIFIYGGNVGWRNINAFIPHQGFDQCLGDGAMDPTFPRNQWGVYDEYLFNVTLQKLREHPEKPKFIFVLTTSNHPPYLLPDNYKPLPLQMLPEVRTQIAGDTELVDKRVAAYQYANQKFGEFLTTLKGSALGTNTVVAATGDHSFHLFDYGRDRLMDVYGVPFYLYVPGALQPKRVDVFAPGSHTDIMPTVYTLTLSDRPYLTVGRDMLGSGEHIGYNTDGVIFSSAAAVRYYYKTDAATCYTWDSVNPRVAREAGERGAAHNAIIKQYRASLAVTDYLVHHPMKPEALGK